MPNYIKIIPFKANVFELKGEKMLQALDFFRLVICFYLIYIIYEKLRKHRNTQEPVFFYMALTLDLAIVFFFSFAWMLSYFYANTKSVQVIQSTEYVDYLNKSLW